MGMRTIGLNSSNEGVGVGNEEDCAVDGVKNVRREERVLSEG